MKIKNYKDYACFDYVSMRLPKYELGHVVINKETKEIGVIIQIHDADECRTDMFGNCDFSQLRLATKKEINKYRPNIEKEVHNYSNK